MNKTLGFSNARVSWLFIISKYKNFNKLFHFNQFIFAVSLHNTTCQHNVLKTNKLWGWIVFRCKRKIRKLLREHLKWTSKLNWIKFWIAYFLNNIIYLIIVYFLFEFSTTRYFSFILSFSINPLPFTFSGYMSKGWNT